MKNTFGVTIIELIVVIAILVILATISVSTLQFFQRESGLNNNTEEVISTLRLAQSKALASEGASQYGVYFDDTTSPHQYILFKGIDFTSRDSSFDEIQKLPEVVEFSNINLDGGNEVVFNRVSGITDQSGNISLRLRTDSSKTRIIYIESSGQVSITSPSVPTDSRIRDSRHVHFDYSRIINTATEKLTLILDISVTKEIIIADNLKEGQIYWEGEIDVGGDIQKLKVHTHRLNNLDTQFCIHRDGRYNNKSLDINISGDGGGSPNLISYTLDGQTTKGSSIYVLEPVWQ